MAVSTGLIAVVPAPAAAPLESVLASVAFLRDCREIMRVVVASDQPIEAEVTEAGAWYFRTHPDLLAETPPRFKLLSDACLWFEKKDGETVRLILAADPLRPMTDQIVVFECLQRVIVNGFADGIVGVTAGRGIAEQEGWLVPDPDGPLQVDGSVFMFRTSFVLEAPSPWLKEGRFLAYHVAGDAQPRGGLI